MKEGINEVEPLGTKPGNDVADALKVMTNQTPLRWRQRRPKPIPGGLGGAGIIKNLLQCALENGLMTGAVTQVRGTGWTGECKSHAIEPGAVYGIAATALHFVCDRR